MATASLDATPSTSTALEGPSVAVIGCGPAGMFFLRQLEKERERLLQAKEQLEQQKDEGESSTSADVASIHKQLSGLPRPTVFEKDSKCGGLWQSKSMAPRPKGGEPEREGMYDGMWINAPKEIFEFADYTFDEHFGRAMPSYITRQQVLGYIEGATNDVIDAYTNNGSIRFDTEVAWIDFDAETNLFQVESIPSGSSPSEDKGGEKYNPDVAKFDKVILATGDNNLAKIPERELEMLKPNDPSTFGSSERLRMKRKYHPHSLTETETQTETQTQTNNELSSQHVHTFEKAVLHSSNINTLGEDISGMNFLFIGSAYSAEDLALSFIKRGANHIYITTRTDSGHPVTDTASWPMDKVTVMLRTEIKEVLPNNRLRLGRRKLPTPTIERIVEKYYNKTHENIVLEDIDAVVFCTGYDIDEWIIAHKLYGYAEWEGIQYNPEAKTNLDPSHWPNIYDPSVFDPEHGKPLPSETNLTSCGTPLHTNSGVLRVNPETDFFYDDGIGTYNRHLITNPGFFHHHTTYDTPLLNLDITSAFILKVLTGEIPTPSTRQEMYEERAKRMADFLRHSSTARMLEDSVFADAYMEQLYEGLQENRPYDAAYVMYRLFLEAKMAGHPAGSFLVEVDPESVAAQPSPYEAAEGSELGCWDMKSYRFYHNATTTYAFSEQGEQLMENIWLHDSAHVDVTPGSNETFRDMHYDEYASVYTGTKPVPFSKLWMEIDDILGDVPEIVESSEVEDENASDDDGAYDDDAYDDDAYYNYAYYNDAHYDDDYDGDENGDENGENDDGDENDASSPHSEL